MKLTTRRKKDLETIMYFMPDLKGIKITDKDIKMFFEHSEQGRHKNKMKSDHFKDGFNLLLQGKRWRGIHIHELYEPGILDGSMPYFVLLGGYKIFDKKEEIVPRNVVDFLKKEMFKGEDAKLIERTYQEILMEVK